MVFIALAGACEEDTTPANPTTGTTTETADTETGGPLDPPTSTTQTEETEGSNESSSAETSASTSSGSTSSDGTTGSSSSGGDETSTGSETSGGGEDIDLRCEGPEGQTECEAPSAFVGEGECDPYAQDCPAGEKCMPWANDGGASWNATRCSPLDPTPDQLGDACVVEGSGVSGVDTCDVGLMCWNVDVATNVGECVELCGCGPESPTCSSDGSLCSIANDGVLPICLPTCDPLADGECPDGQGCYQVQDNFRCAPDASGDDGQVGDPCQYINSCEPGLSCILADAIPGCFSSAGCCTEFCDVDEPNDCTIPGTECLPVFVPGAEPEACHADTGVCAQP